MIESEWLEIVKKVRTIHRWKDFCVQKGEFDTYYEALKEYDAKHVLEATNQIIKNWPWELMVATFTLRIEQVQKDERYSAGRRVAEKKEAENAKRKTKPPNDHGWFRFTHWMFETKTKWPKDRIEVEKLKTDFEKNHPDWQPRKRTQQKRSGMTRIGDVVQDSIGGLAKKEE